MVVTGRCIQRISTEHWMASKGNVQQGGFWNTPAATYSPATQTLLKEMMQESKLNSFQQRQLSSSMRGGGALPVSCHPTSSAKPREPAQKQPPPKVLNPKNYSGGVKSREAILASGAYEKEDYKPRPKLGRTDADKEKLRNKMTYGEELPPPSSASLQAARDKMWRKQLEGLDEPDIDRFQELEREIHERQEFLAEMISLGQGAKYRPIISTEISQKIREMTLIDKERTAELERLIAASADN